MVIIYVFKINYVNMYLGERSYYKWKGRGKVNSSIKKEIWIRGGKKYKTGGENI